MKTNNENDNEKEFQKVIKSIKQEIAKQEQELSRVEKALKEYRGKK